MADTQGTGGFFQVKEGDWDNLNRALRYFCDTLDALTGRRGNLPFANNLDFNSHRGINAAAPVNGSDLVTKTYADDNYGIQSITKQLLTSTVFISASLATMPVSGRVALWDNAATLKSTRITDDDNYIIIGTGTTDAAITSNALVVGSSANVGDLMIVRTGVNSEGLRLYCSTAPEAAIATVGTGAATAPPLNIYVGAGLEAIFATGFIVATGNLSWKSGTSQLGILDHANTGARTYTFADADGNMVYETSALTANQLVIGVGGAKAGPLGSLGTTTTLLHGNAGGAPSFAAVTLTTDVTGVLNVANGGTSGNTAATARTALGFADSQYTPTLTNVANLDASGAFVCQYVQIGGRVIVSGKVTVDPTAAAASTQLGISLPIASNIGAEEDCCGTAFASAIASQGAAIRGDAANNRAEMIWVAGDVTSQPMFFIFEYKVI